MVSREQILERIGGLRQASLAKGVRAPHKPLLLLFLLGRLQRTGTTEVTYSELAEPVSQMISEFGPPARSRHRAELPFVHLSDGLWVQSHSSPAFKHGQLIREGAHGRLLPEVEQALKADPSVLREVARQLLEANFPETYFDPICAVAGLTLDGHDEVLRVAEPGELPIAARLRSAKFREQVLLAYSYACAMCGFDGRVSRDPVGVEAAHVRWHALGGPDEVSNGLALCDLHHTLFDRGVLALDAQHRIEVSKMFNATSEAAKRLVVDLHGQAVRQTNHSGEPVSAHHIEWHRAQVFRAA